MQRGTDLVLKHLRMDDCGAVLVEFAICAPVLLILYLGGHAVSDMISCDRKVMTATRSLTDLVSRTMSPTTIYTAPQNADATSELSASAVVLAPYSLSRATEQISLLRVCDATHAYVVWAQAQTQSADGSSITSTTPNETPGTLPANQPQKAANVIAIPANMVTSPVVPTSPDGSNVCGNLGPGNNNKTQVGTAGGWLFRGQFTYSYTSSLSYRLFPSKTMVDTIYMTPRLY